MMKTRITLFLAFLFALSLLAGCKPSVPPGGVPDISSSPEVSVTPGVSTVPKSQDAPRLSVVATIFPTYDWVREVVGDIGHVDITLLMDNGTDLHSYQATVADIADVAQADLFVYVGGPSDDWVEDESADWSCETGGCYIEDSA